MAIMNYLSIQDLVVMVLGLVSLVLWLMIFFASGKYNSLFESLEEGEYPLHELFSMGYFVTELLHFKYKSRRDKQLRSALAILYDPKFTEFYLRVVYAQAISYALLVYILSFVLYGLSGEILILIVCVAMAAVAVYYAMTLPAEKIKKRSAQVLGDFSEVVSKLALLVGAGMIMKEAWREVAYASDTIIYEEMQKTCDDMDNGVAEMEAIRQFGVRCVIPEIKKFSSTVIQGIEKGNRELASMLRTQSDEIWVARQQVVRRAGAQANTKLMLPMFIMFVGILIMVVVPIFANLGV